MKIQERLVFLLIFLFLLPIGVIRSTDLRRSALVYKDVVRILTGDTDERHFAQVPYFGGSSQASSEIRYLRELQEADDLREDDTDGSSLVVKHLAP